MFLFLFLTLSYVLGLVTYVIQIGFGTSQCELNISHMR